MRFMVSMPQSCDTDTILTKRLVTVAPEPHVLLFRRAKNFDAVQAQEQLLAEQAGVNARAAAKPRRK
jgi:hypothetical protein